MYRRTGVSRSGLSATIRSTDTAGVNKAAGAQARRLAGVSDPTWSPPPAPEDLSRSARKASDWSRTDWPAWVTSTGGFEIGSRWRLTEGAHIVLPRKCAYPTLALGDHPRSGGRYAVEAGAVLTLVEIYDPATDETFRDFDLVSYITYAEDWDTRTYRIETGRSAGVLVRFSATRLGGRFPYSSRLVHAALVPEQAGT
jgi:hypothetical protein